MNTVSLMFKRINEPFGEGFFEDPERSNFYRFSKAARRYFENCTLPEFEGGNLYPQGNKNNDSYAIIPDFSYTCSINEKLLKSKSHECCEYAKKEMAITLLNTIHNVGGNCYTHSIPNFKRIIKEGLYSYKERILKCKDKDFKEGCLELLLGIENYRSRMLDYLNKAGADKSLVDALKKVPFQPANTLYEAIVAWNFIYYIDYCDNLGVMDADLLEYYQGEDMTEVFRDLFANVDKNHGWTCRIGPQCNPLTFQMLKAIKGFCRPSLELCLTKDTPDEVWKLAVEDIKSGSTNPCFYNYDLYQSSLHKRFPDIPEKDLERFSGGGCTETMLAGISRVGSLDAGVNLAIIFTDYLNQQLANMPDFETFYNGLIDEVYSKTAHVLDLINEHYERRAKTHPNPVRTLLIDDCIEKELDFNAGGARWNWSVINFAGMINVIDALSAVKKLVYDRKLYTPAEFLKLLNEEDGTLYIQLKSCPHFGMDDAAVDVRAHDFADKVFDCVNQRKLFFGEGFLGSSIQFVTYTEAGAKVGPTPDGRKAGEPLCDSLSAIHGNDIKGATAMLNSVSKLSLDKALGTPIVNLRLHKKYADALIKPLVLGFFENGGMQIQINCLSKEDMEDAMAYPDKHGDLIVRTGGYSEYFVRLSPELQRTIIKRTEHEL